MMAVPTFGEIDFGFENDDTDDFRAFYRTRRSAIESARTVFAFPGNDGEWVQRHGRRGRPIVWVVELLYVDAADRIAWEQEIESYINDVTYTMVIGGRTYENVQLMRLEELAPPEGCSLPFYGRSFYMLEFRQLTP